jgi:hypothetical protein
MSFLDEFTPRPAAIGVSNTPWGIKPLSGIVEAMRKVRENERLHLAKEALKAQQLAENLPPESVTAREAELLIDKAVDEVLASGALDEADVDAAIKQLDDRPRKELRDILKSGFVPGSEGDRAFAAIHRVNVWDDPANSHSDNEAIFRATNIKGPRYQTAPQRDPISGKTLTEDITIADVGHMIAETAAQRAGALLDEDTSGAGVESGMKNTKALTGGLEGKGSKKRKGSKGLTSEELEFGEELIAKLKVLDDQSTVAVLESLNDAELHALIEASARDPQVRHRLKKLSQVDTCPTLSTRLRN